MTVVFLWTWLTALPRGMLACFFMLLVCGLHAGCQDDELLSLYSECDGGLVFADPGLVASVKYAAHLPESECLGPEDVAGLRELRAVQLVRDLRGVEQLWNLRKLYLNGGSVSDVSPVSSLAKLEELDLGSNDVSDVSPLTSLGKLRLLDIAGNPVRDFSPLAEVKTLRILDLSGPVEDPKQIGALVFLNQLRIGDADLGDGTSLTGLVHLGLLALTYCEVTNLQWMSKLPLLNDLALNYVDDLESLSGLESVAHLHRFALSSTSVADLTPLSGLAELWYLDVSSTPVGPGALATISTMHLDYLDVSYCGIEDLELLAGMHSLDELYAVGNNIRDLQPLAKMSGLEHADLYENRIEDLGPLVPDEACPSLEDLDVRENPLLDCDSQYLNAKKILAKGVKLHSDCPYWIIPSPYRPR